MADEVDHEGQQQLEGHVEVGAVDAATADELEQQPCREAQDDAAEQSAEELESELLAGMAQGKRPREGEPDGGLEDDRAGHVVEERLAGQQRLVAFAEAEVLGELRDGNRVGRAHGGAKSDGGGERDGGKQRVEREAHGDDGDEHEADRKREDAPTVLPERTGIGMARLVEVQRRDEEDEQQLGVEAGIERGADEGGDDGAEGDLHEGQRERGQEAPDDAGGHHGRQQEQHELQRLHGCGSFPDGVGIL
ncbi:MAG: hypothetical protein V8R08_00895 [Coriobacteriales bacterium]